MSRSRSSFLGPHIPLAKPNIQEEDIASVCEVLRSGSLVQGARVAELEAQIAAYLGARHVIAVSNGTASLHLALLALGIGPGDQVIVPAFSFVATANVVEMIGADCVFADIDLATYNIDVTAIDSLLSRRTKAIIPVHEFGLACDVSRIVDWANSHQIAVIEDAACALGARDGERNAGTVGVVGSFSLHPRKVITAGEGGLLATNSDSLAHYLRGLRNHGIQCIDGVNIFESVGLNYRLTDFQAALVIGQVSRLEEGIKKRDSLANHYLAALGDEANLRLPVVPLRKRHIWQTFHLLLDSDVDRAALWAHMSQHGVGSGYGAQCIPALPYYVNKYGHNAKLEFQNAHAAFERGLALPMFDEMTHDEADRVSDVLKSFLNR